MGYYCDDRFAAVSLDSGSFNLSIEVFFNDVVVTIYFCVKLSGGVSIIFKLYSLNATELGGEGPWVYFSLITCEVILTNDAHSQASI